MNGVDRETFAVYARMRVFPPSLRSRLRFDRQFAERHGIRQTVEVTVGLGGPRLDMAVLNAAIIAVLREGHPVEVAALGSDGRWSCRSEGVPGIPIVTLVQGERTLRLPLVFALHPDADVRQRCLLQGDETRQLPAEQKTHWLQKLQPDVLSNEDMADLAADVEALPGNVAERLSCIVSTERFELRRLVPDDTRYYERLVGTWSYSRTIDAYAKSEFAAFVEALTVRGPPFVLSNLTLSAGQPLLSQAIADLRPAVGPRFEEQLANTEVHDLVSLVSLIEISASGPFSDSKRVVGLLDRLYAMLDGAAPESRLFASLFSLTEGELARKGLLQDRPPFWRRLASMAHSALLQRIIGVDTIEAAEFEDLVNRMSGERFALRTLLDLQTEPRWLPRFASAEQFRLEFLGRGVSAARKVQSGPSANDALAAALERVQKLAGSGDQSFIFLPGPAEGNLAPPTELPAELSETLAAGLRRRPVDPSALQQLFSAALLLRIDPELPQLAAAAIHEVVVSGENFPEVLEGELIPRLAHVAAVTRDETLAAEVRVLARVARWSSPARLDARQAFMTGLIARAAFLDREASLEFLSAWLIELARSELSQLDAKAIHQHLTWILNFEPAYWRSLATTEATLAAKAGYRASAGPAPFLN